jgi:hypothetical protein
MSNFQVGQVLVHNEMPEIGRLKVERVSDDQVRLVLDRKHAGGTKTFQLPNSHLVLAADQATIDYDSPKTDRSLKAKSASRRTVVASLPFEEAYKRFLAIYPKGFEDPAYLEKERDYKGRALARWEQYFSASALAAIKSTGDSAAVAHAFGEVFNVIALMHIPGEWIPFHNALKSSPSAIALAEAYAEVVGVGHFTEDSFKKTLMAFEAIGISKPKWTVFSYWPYLATTSGFPFIKPTLIKAAAAGLGAALNYEPTANWLTYSQARDLYEKLWGKLQPLGARDWVDVQSFIWLGWKGLPKTM